MTNNFALGTAYCVYSSSSPVTIVTSSDDEKILFSSLSKPSFVATSFSSAASSSSCAATASEPLRVSALVLPAPLANGLAVPAPPKAPNPLPPIGLAVLRFEEALELPKAEDFEFAAAPKALEDDEAKGEEVLLPRDEKELTKDFAGVD